MTWQPIETAPKDGTPVLAWDPQGEQCCEAFFIQAEHPWSLSAGWYSNHGRNNDNPYGFWPSHWQPLPLPPQEHPHE
jgi:hypothetical protein